MFRPQNAVVVLTFLFFEKLETNNIKLNGTLSHSALNLSMFVPDGSDFCSCSTSWESGNLDQGLADWLRSSCRELLNKILRKENIATL